MIRPIITKVKMNKQAFRKSVINAAGKSKKIQKRAKQQAEKKVERAKIHLLKDFNDHPVTREIEGGPTSFNTSRTIVGRGNLFSFMGFSEGTTPTHVIKNYLEESSYVFKNSKFNKSLSGNYFQFRVKGPTLGQIYKMSPLPWESGRSWVRGVEKGISGIGHYMYGKFLTSRSGTGMQSKNQVKFAAFKTTSYMSKMIDNFRERIKK